MAKGQGTEPAVGAEVSLERRVAHDINNKITPITGFAGLLLSNEDLRRYLPQEVYDSVIKYLAEIEIAGKNIQRQIEMLRGFYRAKEEGIELVEASKLEGEPIKYKVIHIDDDAETRLMVHRSLSLDSNVMPRETGVFGHDVKEDSKGKKVRYEIHSYGNAAQALREINDLVSIDLLLIDREMPELSGYDLLKAINQPVNKKVRRQEFQNVKNVAMLTGGITQQEAANLMETYGIPIITKPFSPLNLEQQIYRIINSQLINYSQS